MRRKPDCCTRVFAITIRDFTIKYAKLVSGFYRKNPFQLYKFII